MDIVHIEPTVVSYHCESLGPVQSKRKTLVVNVLREIADYSLHTLVSLWDNGDIWPDLWKNMVVY